MQPELAEVLRILCMSKRSFFTFTESVERWNCAVELPGCPMHACAVTERLADRWLSLALNLLDFLRSEMIWPHALWHHLKVWEDA